jgi:hypothetical protein
VGVIITEAGVLPDLIINVERKKTFGVYGLR